MIFGTCTMLKRIVTFVFRISCPYVRMSLYHPIRLFRFLCLVFRVSYLYLPIFRCPDFPYLRCPIFLISQTHDVPISLASTNLLTSQFSYLPISQCSNFPIFHQPDDIQISLSTTNLLMSYFYYPPAIF